MAGDDVALHFNPRFGGEKVVRNTKQGGWGKEEKDSDDFPFKEGEIFEIAFLCRKKKFQVKIIFIWWSHLTEKNWSMISMNKKACFVDWKYTSFPTQSVLVYVNILLCHKEDFAFVCSIIIARLLMLRYNDANAEKAMDTAKSSLRDVSYTSCFSIFWAVGSLNLDFIVVSCMIQYSSYHSQVVSLTLCTRLRYLWQGRSKSIIRFDTPLPLSHPSPLRRHPNFCPVCIALLWNSYF